MREVLRATRQRDPEAAEWLEIIDRFDAAVAAEADAAELATVAHEITGRPVLLSEEWNGLEVEIDHSGSRVAGARVREAAKSVYDANLRGRSSSLLEVAGDPVVACAIEGVSGRFGFAALVGATDRSWVPIDHLVAERLAAAVASRARHTREARMNARFAAADLERLLAGGLNDLEIAAIARQANLAVGGTYSAAAVEASPPNVIAPEALAAVAQRGLREDFPVIRTTVIGRTVVVVAAEAPQLRARLEALTRSAADTGLEVHIGLGSPTTLGELNRSWDEAAQSLTLRSVLQAASNVTAFDDLGVLHLLAQIPEETIMRTDLFKQMTSPQMHKGSPSDIAVLEAYLEEGTLRGTAARIFLHHTSVEKRVRRIERHLSLDLTQPIDRFQAQLLLNLYRIAKARSATRVSAL